MNLPEAKRADAHATGHQGFTLTELLVVIAIIAILMAILFPVFAGARVKARQAACASNLKQIGMAFTQYAEDYDGQFPITSHEDPFGSFAGRCWLNTLLPYLANSKEVRICPSDPLGSDRLKQGGTSYVPNEWITLPDYDDWGEEQQGSRPDMFSLKRPSDTITVFIISDAWPAAATSDHTHSKLWFEEGTTATVRWNAILNDIQPDRHRMGYVPNPAPGKPRDNSRYLEGVSNYLYADGHVKAIPARQIKAWADQNFDFAKPPTN